MAQYYYDLSISYPGPRGLPYGFHLPDGMEMPENMLRYGPGINDSGEPAWCTSPFAEFAAYRGTIITDVVADDFEAVIRFNAPLNYSTYNYFNVGHGIVFRFNENDNDGYQACVGTGNSYRSLRFYVNSSQTSNIGASSTTYASDRTDLQRLLQSRFIKVQAIGTALKAKSWWADETEPSDWGVEITHSLFTSGKIGLNINSNTEGYNYEFLSIGTGGDPAPMYPVDTRTVRGLLRLHDGSLAGAGYTVHCFHRVTGMLLGTQVTGPDSVYNFMLSLPSTERLSLLAMDSVGNILNDRALALLGN